MQNGAKECVGGQASHKPILDNRITRSIRTQVCAINESDILFTLVFTYSLCVGNLSSIDVLQCQTQQQCINIYIEERILCRVLGKYFRRRMISCCQIIPHKSCRYHSCFLYFLPSSWCNRERKHLSKKLNECLSVLCCPVQNSMLWKVSVSL